MSQPARPPLSEAAWQAQVIELAHILGWQHLHIRRSIGKGKKWTTAANRVGFPDLFLWHPKHGFAAIELKVGRNQATAEQLQCLLELQRAGARTMVAYPDDLDDVKTLLAGAAVAA